MDAMELVESGDVFDYPNLIAVEKHDFSGVFVCVAQIRLRIELVCIYDARGQIRR